MGDLAEGHDERGGIFAIASDNGRMHLYPDLPGLLESQPTVTAAALELFDLRGRRLAVVYGKGWAPQHLLPVTAPDPDLVRGRITEVLRHASDEFGRERDELQRIGRVLPDTTAGLVDLSAFRDLAGCFDALMEFGYGHRIDRPAAAAVPPPAIAPAEEDRADDRGFWHNFWAHALR
jgi:hypothetical protein